MPVPPLGPPSPNLGCDPGSGTPTTGCPRRPLKSQFRLLLPLDSRTHPGGDLIHRVAPRVSLGLRDSVETGQVGTPLPGRGHPPATSAAAACRGPSGKSCAAALPVPSGGEAVRGAVAPPRRLRRTALLPGRQRSFRVRQHLASWERKTSFYILIRVRTRTRQVGEDQVVAPPLSSLRRSEMSPLSLLVRPVTSRFCDSCYSHDIPPHPCPARVHT